MDAILVQIEAQIAASKARVAGMEVDNLVAQQNGDALPHRKSDFDYEAQHLEMLAVDARGRL